MLIDILVFFCWILLSPVWIGRWIARGMIGLLGGDDFPLPSSSPAAIRPEFDRLEMSPGGCVRLIPGRRNVYDPASRTLRDEPPLVQWVIDFKGHQIDRFTQRCVLCGDRSEKIAIRLHSCAGCRLWSRPHPTDAADGYCAQCKAGASVKGNFCPRCGRMNPAQYAVILSVPREAIELGPDDPMNLYAAKVQMRKSR